MIVREVEENEKELYNKKVYHVIQSWEWGEFRKKTGVDVLRLGHFEGDKLQLGYQMTFHKVPMFRQTIGYFPKGPMPDTKMISAITEIAKGKNVAFVKFEPNVVLADVKKEKSVQEDFKKLELISSKKTLFTKWNFLIDLKKSEVQLLASMHPKTRYNINVAQRYGVQVYESTKQIDFDIYLNLYFETTKRQKYFGHTEKYHKLIWETLMPSGIARVLIARYKGKPLVAWMLFKFNDTLYYPYGGSSLENKEVMASNLICWEAIRLGKKMGLSVFDMWGALAPDAKKNDPWYGFHRFKAGYGPLHVEYVGTYDLILNNTLYKSLNFADKLRWMYLRTRKRN